MLTSFSLYDNIQNIVENNELGLNGGITLRKQFFCLLVMLLLVVSGCRTEVDTVRVGVVPGRQAEIMQVVKEVALADGLEVEIVECSDYTEPNMLLDKGMIDANSYQPQSFLQQQCADRGYDFAVLARTVVSPMGLYSHRISSLQAVPPGAIVVIGADALNAGRAMLLLARAGLIELRSDCPPEAGVNAVAENPLGLQFFPADASAAASLAGQADLLAMGTSCAAEAGFSPQRDALLLETKDSPQAAVLAVRSADREKEALKKLVKAYHSPQVRVYIETNGDGRLLAAW